MATVKSGSEDGVTRPFTETIPETKVPSVGVTNATLAGRSGNLMLAVA